MQHDTGSALEPGMAGSSHDYVALGPGLIVSEFKHCNDGISQDKLGIIGERQQPSIGMQLPFHGIRLRFDQRAGLRINPLLPRKVQLEPLCRAMSHEPPQPLRPSFLGPRKSAM